MAMWNESQIETRVRLDGQLTERAYAKLAGSVTSPHNMPVFRADDLEQADAAARIVLRYCHAEPGKVPESVTDVNQYLDYLFQPSGTMCRTVRLDNGWYKRAFGAMLARLDTGEAIALVPHSISGYQYLEPSTGRKVRVTERVAKHIGTEAILAYRPLPQRPLGMIDLVRFMFGTFDTSDYLLVLAAALAATLMGLLPAWANQIAFNVVVPSKQSSLILPIGALLTGVSLSTVIVTACRNLVIQRISLKLDVVTEAAVFARLMSLPTSFFKQYSSGDVAARTSQMKMLTQLLTTLLLGSGLTTLLSFLYLFQIAAYASSLVIPVFLVVFAQAAFTTCAALLSAHYEHLAKDANVAVSGTVTALLGGISKIKLAGAERRAFAKWADGYATYAQAAYNRPALVRAIPSITAFIGLLGSIAIYWFAGNTHMSVADYMSFSVAYGQMQGAMLTVAGFTGQFAQIGPMLEMVKPLLDTQPETDDERPAVAKLSGAIEVSDVTFRYNPDSPAVLQNLSFTVRPGEYVALVGKSGCGKSTILRLLLGFETPERGSIFYGTHDVSKVDLHSLRSHIGTVMQDGKLFMGNLASNITIASPGATLDMAWEAAEIAGIADDIRKMPMGMQTIVSEGSGGISGGQRQRIMIARAVCGEKRILIFDEATSALDNVTQRHVSESLDTLKCTRLVVAHRLSTVRHCDHILVVDGGCIAEEGTYEELMARNGLFAELVARQQLDTE